MNFLLIKRELFDLDKFYLFNITKEKNILVIKLDDYDNK